MDIVAFRLKSDPWREPRLGVPLPDEEAIVDLQAGHFAMYERPHPALGDVQALNAAGTDGHRLASRVTAWVVTERPPGTLARRDAVDVVNLPEASAELPEERRHLAE